LTQDLNTAKANGFDPAVIDRLNRLVAEGNQLLYGRRPWSPARAANFILHTFPRSVRQAWRGILLCYAFFLGLAVFVGGIVLRSHNAVYDFMPESQVASLEQMYDPGDAKYLTPSGTGSAADMFGFYIYNNISIAFRTFAGGLLGGVGSVFFLGYNAVFLGAAAGDMINSGFTLTFFPFIVAHSAFELTAIVFCSYAGLVLGMSLFLTRGRTRRDSLRAAASRAVPIVAGSALFLVIAAVIEAFWSSRHNLPLPLRFGAGGLTWALVLAYFIFSGREAKK
jgi:uncharacterized membrane protein SpoIIM required for sporulation